MVVTEITCTSCDAMPKGEYVSKEIFADLADTIRALRAQLTSAMSEGTDQALRFDLGELHLEFEVAVTRDASADGGIRFGVISIGGKASLGNEATHRISMTMQPMLVDEKGKQERARISGRSKSEPG
jgi:Trypsin-co-occurring domain 2